LAAYVYQRTPFIGRKLGLGIVGVMLDEATAVAYI
jgi:hypothetical protein